MHTSRIPLELCELIVDYTCDLDYNRPPDYTSLKACALTCSAWVPRTQKNLYRHIWLPFPQSADRLDRTLRAMPHLGNFARQLTVGEGKSPRYISFARGVFMRLFKKVQYLDLRLSLRQYSPQYHLLLRGFPSITELSIAFRFIAGGESILAGFRLIWSLPRLQSCQIWAPEVPRYRIKNVDHEIDILEALVVKREQRQELLKNLSRLSIRFISGMGVRVLWTHLL